jgi:hypothetical protein
MREVKGYHPELTKPKVEAIESLQTVVDHHHHLCGRPHYNTSLMSHRTSWETPRGMYDEHISKFSLSYDTKV